MKEKRGYAYKEKDDKILEEPVPWNDHLMAAERYGIYTHLWKLLRKRTGRQKPLTEEVIGAM